MKKIRKGDAPIAEKLRKRLGRPAKGTDAPVDLELRKLKKRLLIIGIPVAAALIAGVIWLIVSNIDDPPETGIESRVFTEPLPEDCPPELLKPWRPERALELTSFIWGDYILELPEYTQLLDGASLADINLTGVMTSLGMQFEEMTVNGNIEQVSILPLRITAGPRNIDHSYVADFMNEGYGFMSYGVFCEVTYDVIYTGLPYEVEGNKLIVYREWWHGGDDSTDIGVYDDSKVEIEYYFEGYNLVLERNDIKVKLTPRRFADENPWIIISHQVSGNNAFNEIAYIEHVVTPLMPDGSIRTGDGSFISFSDIASKDEVVIELYKEGIMRIIQGRKTDITENSESNENETVLWARFLWCANDGLILIDENGQYHLYQELYTETVKAEPTPTPLTLIERLEIALTEAGIKHEIDPVRGTISASAESDVLFDVNKYELSDSGKEYLIKYFDVLAMVMQSDEFTGSVAEILVEGHTCSRGTYNMNLRLSERRAEAVKIFAESVHPELAEIMDTVGLSYDRPILDENGNEDRDASRRVVFLFTFKTPVG